ncbi:IQ domain-containing protein N [Fukomys damarensis]|uniref:IQ domain-containing protein N n=1 Tax=Fukomys damarensis TaxID=885580 RepID=UPI00053FE160|nr:IQ domain-containing protein N [Fukomys damarensis]
MATKTSPQMHLVTTPVGSPLRTTQPATVCKTPPQPGPSSPKTKPPPRMRLAAIITRTPAAHIRSVAAVLKTLCLTLQAPGNPRAPPGAAQQAAGTPGTSPSLHADTPRTRGPANTPQATAGTAKVSDLRCRAEGSVRVAPQPHLESGARGAPTRGPVRTEKTHTGVQKLVNEETGSKAAAQATRAPSWARLAEERSQPLSQMHQRTEVLKVQSQVYVPIQAEVALPRAQVAVPLTKARALGQPPKVSSQAHPHKAQLAVWPPATSHGPPPTEQTKALSQPHLATCPAKASSRAPPSGGLSKAPSLMHLVTCLTRAQPQAQLVTDATRRVSGSRVKPDHRQGDMGPERQGMLVPLLAAAAATHPSCNVEPWGNSKTTRAQLPTPSQAAPGQEDMVASQIAALCAELVTMLDSQEDLRVLLTKALSQGEVRAILNQALSSEILGATMAKVLPQSMLGMVLAKALSWGELGTTLSRALPRAELCTELTKAVQGRLAEVLSRALTQEERAALSRALCQGELGAVLSQFLSRAAPRTGAVLPKASSKVTSSKMPLLPAPAWGPGLGSPVWLQSHKAAWPPSRSWTTLGRAAGIRSPAWRPCCLRNLWGSPGTQGTQKKPEEPAPAFTGQQGNPMPRSVLWGHWRDPDLQPAGYGHWANTKPVPADCVHQVIPRPGSPVCGQWGWPVDGVGPPPPPPRPFLATRMCPYLSQPRVATLGSPSLLRRPMVWRGGRSFPEPPSVSVGGSGLPGLGIPTIPAQPHPSYPGVGRRPGWGPDQALLGSSMGLRDNPLMVPSTVPDPQDPELDGLCPEFHRPPSICEGLPTADTVPGPHHCQACVALEEDPGPVWGPGASHQMWFRGVTASAPQGHMAPGAFQSLFPVGPRGGLAGDTSWPHTDASVCQCPGADGTAAVASQVLETAAPVLLWGSSGTSGVGQGLSPAAVPQRHRMNQAQLSPGDLDPSVCSASVPLPVILYHQSLGMATGVPSSYQYSGVVTQTPGMGVASSGLVPGCAGRVTMDTVVPDTSGLAFSLPPGSVITDIGQGLPPGPVIASRVATRQVAASGPRGKPCLSIGPLARFSAPSLPPSSLTCSLDPQVPLDSMAECVGCSPLPRSLLIGLSPRPFRRARPGEDPTGASQGSGAVSLAQIHPQALAESQASPALSRASRFGRRMSGAPGGQARWRPAAAWESAPQAPGSCRKPGPAELLQGPAWLHPGPLDTDVHCDPRPLFVEGPLPKDSMPPLREAAPSHAIRGASVPAWALSSSRHPMASDTTAVLQPKSASSWGPPGLPLEAASWSPGVQAGSVLDGATCRPLAPAASEGRSFLHKSLALLGVGGCSQGTVASRAASQVPQLAPDSLHPESVARVGSPSLPWRLGAAGVMAHVPARQSWAKPATAALPQGEAAPRAPQKPTPHDWPPSSPAQSPDARRLCKSHQDSLVPALLEGPAAELGPRSPRLDSGLTPESVAQGRSGPRPSRGQESAPQWPLFDQSLPCFTGPRAHHRKLSLTPGSLQAQLPHYFSGPTVSHCKPSLTPGVPQGPVDTGTCDQPCNSPVPSVAVRPLDRFVGPHNMWQPPRGSGLWGRTGQAGTPDWTVSLQHMERVVIRAATVIQACARGCLVRRTIKVWHQRATVIQATWRGHHVRRNLARLYRATVVIQAAWRGHRVRQARARHMHPRAPQELWDAAATTIQSAWKGFKVRRQLRKQQSAARMLQATWRGHYTRSCLTPEALLGTGSPWDSAPGAPRLGTRLSLHWPGI